MTASASQEVDARDTSALVDRGPAMSRALMCLLGIAETSTERSGQVVAFLARRLPPFPDQGSESGATHRCWQLAPLDV
jgi:hypothetical protein